MGINHQLLLEHEHDRSLYAGLSAEQKARASIVNAFAANPFDFSDRFRVAKVIGFGSNGVVLAAEDLTRSTGSAAVAIKIIYKDPLDEGRIVRTPPPEIAVLRALSAAGSSKYIVRSIADWQDPNHFYLVTELFGQSWIDVLNDPKLKPLSFTSTYRNVSTTHNLPFFDGSSDLWAYIYASRTYLYKTEGHRLLPLDPIRQIIKQTASALAFIHSKNFYHGDVKCENILVSQVADLSSNTHTTSIRLADFGHARTIYNGIESYGTRAISPPEFLEDSPFAPEELDGRCSDVFALGIVMFSLLNDAGDSAPSIPCESMYEALEVYDGGRYPISGISDLDQEGWDLLNAMCRVDPFQRITMRQVLNHSWLQDIRI